MRDQEHVKGVWRGIGVVALCHLGVALLFTWNLIFPVLLISLTQLIYCVPLSFVKRPGFVQGVWIAAGITFLLNAACFGIVIGVMVNGLG
ncbi:MAG TPA: hypothetical protein VFV52_14390 [Bacilli bacterium]|nr:hypothetical protein [Bacilli bacterium]